MARASLPKGIQILWDAPWKGIYCSDTLEGNSPLILPLIYLLLDFRVQNSRISVDVIIKARGTVKRKWETWKYRWLNEEINKGLESLVVKKSI